MRHLSKVVVTLLGCSALLADEPEVVKRWTFHAPADVAGWRGPHDGKELRVENETLRLTITGVDTYIEAPAIYVPLDGVMIRVRLRSDRDGDTQLYWHTADMPHFDQLAFASRHTAASPAGELRTVEFRIGKPSDAGQKLTGLRIDPFNGNEDGTVEIRSVEILRLPPILDVSFSFEEAQVDVGQSAHLRAWVRHLDGRGVTAPLELGFNNKPPLVSIAPAKRSRRVHTLTFDKPGVKTVLATFHEPGGKTYRLDASVIVGRDDRLPLKPALRTSRVSLDLVPTEPGGPFGAARWQIADKQGRWLDCGWLMPLYELTLQSEGGVTRSHVPLSTHELQEGFVSLKARLPIGVAGVWFAVGDKNQLTVIRTKTYLHAESDVRLLELAGPVVRSSPDPGKSRSPLHASGLFGGIEFLEPGWTSSSDRAVGKRHADRWSPAPHKISMPVMAVEESGRTAAMMWDPEQRWTEGESMPSATFALHGRRSNLMKLSIPGTPKYRIENSGFAQSPYPAKASEKLAFAGLLYAEPDLPVAMISKRYYDFFEPPALPPPAHGDLATYDLIARNFGETMYTPGKGWTMHWFFPEEPRFIPMMAGELVAHAAETGDTQWIERTGQTGRGIIETCGSLAGQLAGEVAAQAAINAMRPDGTFAFHNTERMRQQTREFTKGEYDSLGQDGSTSLGTCVQAALPLLRYALLTGDEKYLPACRRVLDAMSWHFRVPRGAQVWEVHQEIPDIRAAALAVEAFQIGYRLTREERYLDAATYWAWTGVPFVYSWHVPLEDELPGHLMSSRDRSKPAATSIPLAEAFQQPRRRVTPYATIPVLGPTFYVHSWFGVPVQWCGLEWAYKVLDHLKDRPDALLKAVADGVIASGLQQTFDKPPWVGLYPDSWDLALNRAQGALLSAHLTLQCLQSQERVPLWTRTWTRVVRSDAAGAPASGTAFQAANPGSEGPTPRSGVRWHVSGWGPVPRLTPPLKLPLRWSVALRYPQGQLNELVVANADKPQRISIDDDLLDELPTPPLPGLPEGWSYDAPRRLIMIRFRQPAAQTPVGFEW